MARISKTPWSAITFTAAITKRVLENPLERETPTSRIKQMGFMGLIYQMKLAGIEPTVNNIMEISGLSRTSVFEIATPLIDRGLLKEQRILNSQGRGRASKLDIAPDILEGLPEALHLP